MQPTPKPNSNQPIHEQVIEDIKLRAEAGKQNYGTYLQAGNGRDSLLDAYEEAQDKALYLKQAILERDQLRAELTAAKNLLARIHRDGGHHTEAVGFAQSVADAGDKVSEWLLAAEERTALAAHDAAVKVAVLREICKNRTYGGMCRSVAVDYYEWIGKQPLDGELDRRPVTRVAVLDASEVLAEADRIEKEAANGQA